MTFYPKLQEEVVKLIIKNYEANPNYFTDPSCPYSQEVKDIFCGKAKVQDFQTYTVPEIKPDELLKTESILSYVVTVLTELSTYGTQMKSSGDSGINTYFRLSATVLEKLIAIKERIVRIDQFEKFVTTVLETMDKSLDADQRETVMTKLQEIIKQEQV